MRGPRWLARSQFAYLREHRRAAAQCWTAAAAVETVHGERRKMLQQMLKCASAPHCTDPIARSQCWRLNLPELHAAHRTLQARQAS